MSRICITGAAGHLGSAISEHLAAQGDQLLLNGRNAEKLKAFAEDLQLRHPKSVIRHYAADMNTPDGIRGAVELMEGEKVVFRYYLSTGGYKDTAFPLSGAAAAISTAVGIDAEIDHSAQRKAEEFKDAYTAESKKCQRDLSTFKRCLERLEVCRTQSEYDVDRSQNCIR